GRRRGPVHGAAVGGDVALEQFEVVVQVRQRVLADLVCGVAQPLELGQRLDRVAPVVDESAAGTLQGRLQVAVEQRLAAAAAECRTRPGDDAHERSRAGAPSPMPGVSPGPTSHSATWYTLCAIPLRRRRPAMFIRQPRSPPSTTPTPVASMAAVLSATMRVEMSRYFTQNVPPKPQHTLPSASSTSSTSSGGAMRARGCSRTPSSRRPEQESW